MVSTNHSAAQTLRRIAATTLLLFAATSTQAANPRLDLAEVCFHAASDTPDLVIDAKILGYCSTAIGEATDVRKKATLLNNRAILRIRQEDTAAARTDLDEALRLDRSNAGAWITLGHLHWLEGNLVAAESAFTSALALGAPPLAAYNRSIVRRSRGDLPGAIQDALLAAGYATEEIETWIPEAAPQHAPPSAMSGAPAASRTD